MILAALLWHVLTIGQVTAEDPCAWQAMRTHLEVTGFVTYRRRQEDGDWHLRICDAPDVRGMDRVRCIVAEVIPALPFELPRKGAHVRVRGIYRWDGERGHRFHELHPVLSIEALE